MSGAFLGGLIAGSSFLVGSLLAARVGRSRLWLGLLTGFGAGALIAAVAYELVDSAGDLAGSSGRVAVGLLVGSALFLAATRIAPLEEATPEQPHTVATISRRLVVDVVPEAIIIAGSILVHHHIGPAVVVAVFLCGVPEGIASTVRLHRARVPDGVIAMSWIALSLLCGGVAALAWRLLDGAADTTLALTLAIAGGAILTNLTTELVPDGYELAGRRVGIASSLGFALVFALAELT